jgi:ketosteroid isomerase-like protein
MPGELDGTVSNYTEDALFITPDGVVRGKEGVREGFVKLLPTSSGCSPPPPGS